MNKIDVYDTFSSDAYWENVVEEAINRGILEKRDELVILKTSWGDLDNLREELWKPR